MNAELARILQRHAFIRARRADPLRDAVEWAAATGELTRMLPGIWTTPGPVPWWLRAAALQTIEPDVVFCAETAAALILRTRPPSLIRVEVPRRRRPIAGFAFSQRVVRPESIVTAGIEQWTSSVQFRLRCTDPALTAVDLSATDNGHAIDEVLRMRLASLDDLWSAFSAGGHRRGNSTRRRVLEASASEPWSQAERRAHQLLRGAGVSGWRANQPQLLGDKRYYGDIVFPRHRVLIEIDGWEHHSSRDAFERDRARQNQWVLAGWAVLRFTWAMLVDAPQAFVRQVQLALQEGRWAAQQQG